MFKRLLGKRDAPAASYDDRFAAARMLYERDALAESEAAFLKLIDERPGHAAAWMYAGLCAFYRGDPATATVRHARAGAIDAANPEFPFLEAMARAAGGATGEAKRMLADLAARHPQFHQAHTLWASIELPGDGYFSFLQRLHEWLAPPTYLEIGVFQGQSLQYAGARTQAIGVDPAPALAYPLPAGARVVNMTSDDFFARHDVRSLFGGRPVALGFIDGMHLFEFALRDFINLERNAAPDGTILIHDCYPLDRATAERERRTHLWSGDVWRLILVLRKYRPDLSVHTLAFAPTGLGMVRGLDPQSRLLADNYDAIVAEFLALDYSVLDDDKAGALALFPNDWERIRGLLGNAHAARMA